MAAGDGFSDEQRYQIDRAIRAAETISRCEFSVYVGSSEGETGPFARRLHASLSAPERSVLLFVDPAARILEVVTGAAVRRHLSEEAQQLAVVAMQSAFSQGDLVGGIKRGLAQLAEAAARPRTLHTGS